LTFFSLHPFVFAFFFRPPFLTLGLLAVCCPFRRSGDLFFPYASFAFLYSSFFSPIFPPVRNGGIRETARLPFSQRPLRVFFFFFVFFSSPFFFVGFPVRVAGSGAEEFPNSPFFFLGNFLHTTRFPFFLSWFGFEGFARYISFLSPPQFFFCRASLFSPPVFFQSVFLPSPS